MQVDVEKDDGGRSPHPVQDGLGADENPGIGRRRVAVLRLSPACATSWTRHLAPGDAEQRLELLAEPADPRPHGAGAQPAACGADDRTDVAAARAPQRVFVGLAGGRAPHRAHRASSPHGAREQARATLAVVHADEQSVRLFEDGAGRCTNSSEKRPVRGSAPRRSTRSRKAQPLRSPAPGAVSTVAGGSVTGGTGDTSRHAASSRRARSTTTSTALYVGALSSR